MEDIKIQQIEALKVAAEYCSKLITAIDTIVKEYEGDKLPDTDEYLQEIVKGLNWTFEVFNGTKELINKEDVINKDKVNESVLELNAGISEKNDSKIAAVLKGGILEFVNMFKAAAERECA